METCGTEEPYEGKPHVRICGGAGWATTGSTRTVFPPERDLRAERYLDILQEWAIISDNDISFCALKSPKSLHANRFNGHQPSNL